MNTQSVKTFFRGFLITGALLVAVGLAATLFFETDMRDAEHGLLRVAEVSGTVQITEREGGRARAVTTDTVFRNGARMTTAKSSTAVVVVAGAGVFALAPETEIVLETVRRPGDAVVSLVRGAVKALVVFDEADGGAEGGEREITVRAPTVTASVGGTAAGEMVVVFDREEQTTTTYATKNKVFLRGPETTEAQASGLSMPAGTFSSVDVRQNASSPEPFEETPFSLRGLNLDGFLSR